jgi:hypothetical protein
MIAILFFFSQNINSLLKFSFNFFSLKKHERFPFPNSPTKHIKMSSQSEENYKIFNDDKYSFETKAIHVGQEPEKW